MLAIEYNQLVYSADEKARRNPEKIRALIRSYARNTAAPAAIETILADISGAGAGGVISRPTADGYIRELQNLYVIDDQPAWSASLRSRTPLRQTPKRHLADPSLAAAAIGATAEKLRDDVGTLGFLFESLCVRDIRVYTSALDCTVSYYRDKTGLEADIIIERPDGAWGAMEVKLGSAREEEAAKNLLRLSERVDTSKIPEPSFLAIITNEKYPYKRKDGIFVIPIGCLAP